MKNKHEVHNLIILDESGSMDSIKRFIIQGFNELVQTVKGAAKQFPEQAHFISMISFNGLGKKIHHFADPVTELNELNSENYKPDASTPLYDAIGYAALKLEAQLKGKKNLSVLVTILTDGEENASREYNATEIKELVNRLKKQDWTFTYIGADHDVTAVAHSISITNTMTWHKSEAGIKDMFVKETNARMKYFKAVENKEESKADYYRNIDDEKPK